MSGHRYIDTTGPDDPHAFDGITLQMRGGELDVACPICLGHGQWNARIDLGSQRSQRAICPNCEGRGWLEIGDDHIAEPDIESPPGGRPRWYTRFQQPGDSG